MKRAMVAMVIGAGVIGVGFGCEEKKNPPAGLPGGSSTAGMADKAKEMADKGKDMAANAAAQVKGEVQNLLDTAKGKMDGLNKHTSGFSPEQKAEFDKAMAGLKDNYDQLLAGFNSASKQTGDAMAKAMADVKDQGQKFLDQVKATGLKFGITAP